MTRIHWTSLDTTSRVLAAALAASALAAGLAGCLDTPRDHAHPHPEGSEAIGTWEAATTCAAHLDKYPVNGAHNGGWDKNALNYTCPTHPSSSPDNSDFIKGDHFGNDLFAKKGTPVVAPVGGTVTAAGTSTIGGKHVTIKDSCGWAYYHAHLDSIQSGITVGKVVKAGDKIGTVGNTGNASGTSPHVHFSIYPAGNYEAGIDPFPLLQKVDAGSCGSTSPPPPPPPPPPPATPNISIDVKTFPPSGQTKDFRPEGTSKDVMDLYVGQTFTAEVWVSNAVNASNTSDGVEVGVWFEDPWLDALGYTIYTDWPAKDQKTWKVNDSNSEPSNPDHANAPKSAKYKIYAFSAGETKKIVFTVKANQYSIGKLDHPDVRAWVWHVGNWYGEQTAWNDPVETNKAGKVLQDYVQHDVYALDHWDFDGVDAAETEGWKSGNATSEVKLNTSAKALAIKMAGSDPYVIGAAAEIDAGKMKAVKLKVRTYEGAKLSQLFFTTKAETSFTESKSVHFVSPGDGGWHDLTVDFSKNAKWTGTVTKLRLDPAVSDTVWYDVAELGAAKSGTTSGDSDGDGHLASPGDDCDDKAAGVYPGAKEQCNAKDDDCDGKLDEGYGLGDACSAGEGACLATGKIVCADATTATCSAKAAAPGVETCNGADDDCDGKVDEGLSLGAECTAGAGLCASKGVQVCGPGGQVVCDAPAPKGVPELCNGKDDDCDGAPDDGFGVGEGCVSGTGACAAAGVLVCSPSGAFALCSAVPGTAKSETCNGADDDCDGATDEVFALGQPCTAGEGVCKAGGVTACDGSGGAACSAVAGTPVAESCNGLDDDCDGTTDEGFGLGQPCAEGLGVCEVAGVVVCDGGGVPVCSAKALEPSVEVCNGLDDDCDGAVDQGFEVGAACTVGEGACAVSAEIACSLDGSAFCGAVPGEPAAGETCDGTDDDCDGETDEGFGLGAACEVGSEDCAAMGTLVCDAEGQVVCSAKAGDGSPEVCNAVDDDCNGTTDEGFNPGVACELGAGACVAQGKRTCSPDGLAAFCDAQPGVPGVEVPNGIDDDCDGEVDEADVPEPGADPDDPGGDPKDRGTDPDDPGDDPDDPGDDPDDRGNDPDDPGTDPTDPGADPGLPGADPTDPGDEPDERGTDPASEPGGGEGTPFVVGGVPGRGGVDTVATETGPTAGGGCSGGGTGSTGLAVLVALAALTVLGTRRRRTA